MNLWRLTWIFAVLSLLGFGGGNAIIPQMHDDVVNRFHWITSAEFARFYALGRLAPGPTTTMSALIGYAVAGFAGAAVAAVAMYVPAATVVVIAARVWDRFHAVAWRATLMRAIAPVTLGLIWAGVATLGRGALDGTATIAIAVAAAGLMLFARANPALLILAAGAVGAIFFR